MQRMRRSAIPFLSTLLGARAVCAVAVIVGLSCAGCATGRKPFAATQVSPGILVGPQPRGQANYEALRAHGVRTILSLQVLPWAVAYGRRHAKTFGIAFQNVPVPASILEPSERRIKEALMTLRDQTLRPIFIHCNLGRDRIALIVGLYRIYYEDWTPEAAWDEMLRTGFKVRWSLRGLRTYFWSHCQKPVWVKRDFGRLGQNPVIFFGGTEAQATAYVSRHRRSGQTGEGDARYRSSDRILGVSSWAAREEHSDLSCRHRRGRFACLERIPEPANRLTQTLPEFRKPLRSEDDQGNQEDHQKVHRLEKTFTHFLLAFLNELNAVGGLGLPEHATRAEDG